MLTAGKVELPASLGPAAADHRRAIDEALRHLSGFAQANQLKPVKFDEFVTKVRAFDSKASFDAAVLEASHAPAETKLPVSYAATVLDRVVFAVCLPVFLESRPKATRPGYVALLVHELMHQLHVDVLLGDERAMGPVWFFEGLAVAGAGQYEDGAVPARERIEAIVQNPDERGDYREYGAMVRHLSQRVTMGALIARAGDPRFAEWAKAQF